MNINNIKMFLTSCSFLHFQDAWLSSVNQQLLPEELDLNIDLELSLPTDTHTHPPNLCHLTEPDDDVPISSSRCRDLVDVIQTHLESLADSVERFDKFHTMLNFFYEDCLQNEFPVFPYQILDDFVKCVKDEETLSDEHICSSGQ